MASNDGVEVLQSKSSTSRVCLLGPTANPNTQFLMSKLIRYCPSIRSDLITDLTPALPSLLSHADAVQPLSDFFDLYATAREKRQLVRGFYPKEVRIFDGANGEKGEWDMGETLEKMGEGAQRSRVLEGVEKNVLGP